MDKTKSGAPRRPEAQLLLLSSLITILGFLTGAASSQIRQSFDPLPT